MADWFNERDMASVKASILADAQNKEIDAQPAVTKRQKILAIIAIIVLIALLVGIYGVAFMLH